VVALRLSRMASPEQVFDADYVFPDAKKWLDDIKKRKFPQVDERCPLISEDPKTITVPLYWKRVSFFTGLAAWGFTLGTFLSAFSIFPNAPIQIWILPCIASIALHFSVALKIYNWRNDVIKSLHDYSGKHPAANIWRDVARF
jgi:hypothetical protein